MNKKLYIVILVISLMSFSAFAGSFQPATVTKKSLWHRLALKAKSMVSSPNTLLKEAVKNDDAKQVEDLLYRYQELSLDYIYLSESNESTNLLMYAICCDALNVVRFLLGEQECDVNEQEYIFIENSSVGGNTALMIAIGTQKKFNHLAIIKALLKHKKIDVNIVNCLGQTALDLAIATRQIEVIDLLLAHPDIDLNIGRYGSALCAAIISGDIRILRRLLSYDRINVNYIVKNNDEFNGSSLGNYYTALTLAVEIGDVAVVRELLTHRSIDCRAGLILAAAQPNLEMLQEFLSCSKVDVNAMVNEFRGRVQTNALLQAAYHGHTKIVQALLVHPKIDVNVRDEYGQIPMLIAAKRGHCDIIKLLQPYYTATDFDGIIFKALRCLVKENSIKSIQKLLQAYPVNKSYLFNLVNKSVASQNKMNIVDVLIKHGGKPKKTISLHHAAATGCLYAMKYSLEQGADLCAVNEQGNTALMEAIMHKQNNAMKLLLAYQVEYDQQVKNLNRLPDAFKGYISQMIGFKAKEKPLMLSAMANDLRIAFNTSVYTKKA